MSEANPKDNIIGPFWKDPLTKNLLRPEDQVFLTAQEVKREFVVIDVNSRGLLIGLPDKPRPKVSSSITLHASATFNKRTVRVGDILSVTKPNGSKFKAKVLYILKNGFLYLKPEGTKGAAPWTDFLKLPFVK